MRAGVFRARRVSPRTRSGRGHPRPGENLPRGSSPQRRATSPDSSASRRTGTGSPPARGLSCPSPDGQLPRTEHQRERVPRSCRPASSGSSGCRRGGRSPPRARPGAAAHQRQRRVLRALLRHRDEELGRAGCTLPLASEQQAQPVHPQRPAHGRGRRARPAPSPACRTGRRRPPPMAVPSAGSSERNSKAVRV